MTERGNHRRTSVTPLLNFPRSSVGTAIAQRPAMHKLVARAPKGRLLFRTDREARALWRIVRRQFPEADVLTLMPNHIHVDPPHEDPSDKLTDAMRAYAIWRNHHRDEDGPVWESHPPPEAPADDAHARRYDRYVLLNPPRARLTKDPLEWVWTSHRDLVGCGIGSGIQVVRNPEEFHRYVSSDDTCSPSGTPFPRIYFGKVEWPDVVDAVCSVLRLFNWELLTRGPGRTLALKTAWAHGLHDVEMLAAATGSDVRTVYRTVRDVAPRGAVVDDPALFACIRAVGDRRFRKLQDIDLRDSPAWRRTKYANLW